MSVHPAIQPGRVAVVTGAASGIGLAAASRFASLGLKVVLADIAPLDEAAAIVSALSSNGAADVLAVPTEVADLAALENLDRQTRDCYGRVDVLMNNAGIEAGGRFWSGPDVWRRILEVNLWGTINGMQAFVPAMVASGEPGLVVNTGSKQGITTPPGNAPYNISKAGLKVATEALAYELRTTPGCRVTAHLLIPGFVYTGLTRARGASEKPTAAWTPEQTVDFMLDALGRGDFYILCPDNDVRRETDEKRMLWGVGDIVENRSALSRWDPRWKNAFETYMNE